MEQEQRSRDAADALAALAPLDESDGGADVDDVGAQLRSFLRGEQRSVVVAPERRDLVKGTATAGGNTVVPTFTLDTTNHKMVVVFPSTTWTTSTITARAAVALTVVPPISTPLLVRDVAPVPPVATGRTSVLRF